MKNITLLIAAAALAAATFVACKPTEDNYRAAYQRAVEKDRDGIDETIYNRIRQEARPEELVLGTDTVPMRSERVFISDGQTVTAADFHRYCVVVAQFKQLFNARSMVKRLAENGYEGAFVVNTREPLYYVVLLSTDTPADATAAMRSFAAKPPFRLQEDCPWILRKR